MTVKHYTSLDTEGYKTLSVFVVQDDGTATNVYPDRHEILTAKSKDLAERIAGLLNADLTRKQVSWSNRAWICASAKYDIDVSLSGTRYNVALVTLLELYTGMTVTVVCRRPLGLPEGAQVCDMAITHAHGTTETPYLPKAAAEAYLARLGITADVLHAFDAYALDEAFEDENDRPRPARLLDLDP